MTLNFKCCDINVKNFVLCKGKKKRENRENRENRNSEDDGEDIEEYSDSFELTQTQPKRYDELIPEEGNFLYLKFNLDSRIISISDNKILKMFNMRTKDILNKKINELPRYKDFFRSCVLQLFNECINKGDAYQFEFILKKNTLTCSLYPCFIPCGEDQLLASVDLVIRRSKFTPKNYKLKMTSI